MATSAAVVMPQRRKALASVKKGVLNTPVRVLVYGAEKVGKSTFAAGAPKPVFIGAESGTERLDVDRLQPSSWDEAVAWVGDLATEQHEYQTLVVDPVNWLEPMAWDALCRKEGVDNIEQVGGGYMKGYTASVDLWRVMLSNIERCWLRGMHVVLVGHSLVKTFKNPEGPEYDRYELAMHPKAAGLLKQWVDAVLFARLETFAKAEKGKRAKGIVTGARVLHTEPAGAFDAGNRWKMPPEIPLSWESFMSAVQDDRDRLGELVAQITAMAAQLSHDPKVASYVPKFLEAHKGNADRLAEMVNRLALKIDETHQEQAK